MKEVLKITGSMFLLGLLCVLGAVLLLAFPVFLVLIYYYAPVDTQVTMTALALNIFLLAFCAYAINVVGYWRESFISGVLKIFLTIAPFVVLAFTLYKIL